MSFQQSDGSRAKKPSTGIPGRDVRLLYQQSGNRCAFPSCTRTLTAPKSALDGSVPTSEVAHIVGESINGPRGDHDLPLEERNRYENLILLCEEHHHIIDTQTATYPVERLRQFKYDHEALIAEATRQAVVTRAADHASVGSSIVERLFSSLLPVERLPANIFSIEWNDTNEKEVQQRLVRTEPRQAAPFLIRGGRLYCFQNLRDEPGPFQEIVRGVDIERHDSAEWWDDDDRGKWFVTLLNRTLNKVTGWRGLKLDKTHFRYYFDPDESGKTKTIFYRPLNVSTSKINVVWQPITKKTGMPKKFWYHRAVALSFVRVGKRSWCLALRPEMRVTRDGVVPLDSERVGGKVTKKKSKMWNLDVLEELNFWRYFFFRGDPRLIISFGGSVGISIGANFLSEDIRWPGVPPERARKFKNAEVEENLFDLAALDRLDQGEDEDVLEAFDELLENGGTIEK